MSDAWLSQRIRFAADMALQGVTARCVDAINERYRTTGQQAGYLLVGYSIAYEFGAFAGELPTHIRGIPVVVDELSPDVIRTLPQTDLSKVRPAIPKQNPADTEVVLVAYEKE